MKSFSLPLLAVLFSFLVCSPVIAQITITTTDILNWYAVGKGQKHISSDTAKYTMNVGNTSASATQVWTLPSVLYKDTMLIKNIVPSSTPYSNKFPLATHAQNFSMVGDGFSVSFFSYTRIASDSFLTLGTVVRQIFGTKDTTMFNVVPKSKVKMPFALGTVITDKESLYFGPGDYEVRKFSETVDAFGTITLPIGTFPCLRSKNIDTYLIYHTGQPAETLKVNRFTWRTKEGHEASVTASRSDQISGTIPVEKVIYSTIMNVSSVVPQTTVPKTCVLLQNYPNPFNPTTSIRYSIPLLSRVNISIYNSLGQLVDVILNEEQSAGWKEVQWNAKDVSSGIYFYKLTAGSFVEIKKMQLLK